MCERIKSAEALLIVMHDKATCNFRYRWHQIWPLVLFGYWRLSRINVCTELCVQPESTMSTHLHCKQNLLNFTKLLFQNVFLHCQCSSCLRILLSQSCSLWETVDSEKSENEIMQSKSDKDEITTTWKIFFLSNHSTLR